LYRHYNFIKQVLSTLLETGSYIKILNNHMNSKYLNALNLTFGTQRTRRLIQNFKSAEKVWVSPMSKFTELRIKREVLEEIFKRKEIIDPDQEWEKLLRQNIELITFEDPYYPKLLKETYSPPLGIYTKGNKDLLNTSSLAIVGTRSPSTYGREVMGSLIGPLCAAGLTIVSGLAQGIDALAHQATIDYEGNTIAVLGCGLHQVFPKINQLLAESILQKNGLIITEYPLGTPPLKQHFPARNRIIAGLSLGVFVVESRLPGGALITTSQALEANREVFALPGSVKQATSDGTNMLIKKGAKLVVTAKDILEELSLPMVKEILKDTLKGLNPEEKNIVNVLESEPLHIDKIIKQAKLSAADVNALMTSLELKGIVKNTGGGIYTRNL